MGAQRGRGDAPAADGVAGTQPEDGDLSLETPADRGEAQVSNPVPAIVDVDPDEPVGAPAPKPGHAFVRIAARRSLRVPVVTGQRFEGDVLVDVHGSRTAHAGEVVEVREDEVVDLRTLGFVEHGGLKPAPELVPDASIVGPTVNGRSATTFKINPAG